MKSAVCWFGFCFSFVVACGVFATSLFGVFYFFTRVFLCLKFFFLSHVFFLSCIFFSIDGKFFL